MKKIVERYVYDVTRRLPENQREEVSKELFANIEDMLNGSTKEEDIEKVLLGLGQPRDLANEYREKKRYLISPRWMDDYLRTLKVVLIIFMSISFIFALIDSMTNPEATTVFGIVLEVFGKTISETIQSAFRAFAIVTIIFVGIEAYDLSPKRKEWTLSQLPELPKANVKKLSRTGTIVELSITIIFGCVWIFLLYNHQTYIGWMVQSNHWIVSIPLFNNAAIMNYIPLFIVSLVISVAASLLALYYGYLNLQVAIASTVEKVISFAVFIFFVTQPDLISNQFIQHAATFFNTSSSSLTQGIHDVVLGFVVLTGIANVAGLIHLWIKTVRSNELKPTKIV